MIFQSQFYLLLFIYSFQKLDRKHPLESHHGILKPLNQGRAPGSTAWKMVTRNAEIQRDPFLKITQCCTVMKLNCLVTFNVYSNFVMF